MKDLEKKQMVVSRQWGVGVRNHGLTGSPVEVGVYFSNALSNMDIRLEKLMTEFGISEKIKQKSKGPRKKKSQEKEQDNS